MDGVTVIDDFYTTDSREKDASIDAGYQLIDTIGHIIDPPLGPTTLEPIYAWLENIKETVPNFKEEIPRIQ